MWPLVSSSFTTSGLNNLDLELTEWVSVRVITADSEPKLVDRWSSASPDWIVSVAAAFDHLSLKNRERKRERVRRSELLSTGCLIPWSLCDLLHSSFLYTASMKQGHIPKCWALKNVKQGKQARSLPGVNKLAKLFPLPPVLCCPSSTHSFKVAAPTSWTPWSLV